mmetsp:Transcript_9077/g.23752  ORF Transcript_9077/g.23752 Transcript_9077/m.23752 type:complete len:229 (-) Transcript_9077:1331-2017(-)
MVDIRDHAMPDRGIPSQHGPTGVHHNLPHRLALSTLDSPFWECDAAKEVDLVRRPGGRAHAPAKRRVQIALCTRAGGTSKAAHLSEWHMLRTPLARGVQPKADVAAIRIGDTVLSVIIAVTKPEIPGRLWDCHPISLHTHADGLDVEIIRLEDPLAFFECRPVILAPPSVPNFGIGDPVFGDERAMHEAHAWPPITKVVLLPGKWNELFHTLRHVVHLHTSEHEVGVC